MRGKEYVSDCISAAKEIYTEADESDGKGSISDLLREGVENIKSRRRVWATLRLSGAALATAAVLSTVGDTKKATDNLLDANLLQIASSAVHLGIEIPLTRKVLQLKLNGIGQGVEFTNLNPGQEVVLNSEPQALEPSIPIPLAQSFTTAF